MGRGGLNVTARNCLSAIVTLRTGINPRHSDTTNRIAPRYSYLGDDFPL